MSHIITTDGVSDLPGLKTRIQKELETLVASRGWDAVKSYGRASAWREEKLRSLHARREEGHDSFPSPSPSHKHNPSSTSSLPAAHQPHDYDPIDMKFSTLHLSPLPPSIRIVNSLGAWAGASLVAQQRIKGLVEIDREKWLKEGIQGANREKEGSVVQQRMSLGPGQLGGKEGRGSWGLGVWA